MVDDLANVLTQLQAALHPDGRAPQQIGGATYLKHAPQITCADGFKLSVQASHFHYCSPRDSTGPWDKVEVGYPSARTAKLMPYIDGDEDGDDFETVYGYVPISIVAHVIADHGGFAQLSATLPSPNDGAAA